MELGFAIPLLLVGFVCLVKGADWFVDGAAGIAEKLRVPQLIIGLTVVSFGTSAPELATSIISAAEGSAELAIGNIFGSNIMNVLLILGLAAVICPLVVQQSARRFDLPVLVGASILILLLGAIDNQISRWEGLLMFLLSCAYTAFLIWYGMRESKKSKGKMPDLNNHEVVGKTETKQEKKGFAGWYERMKEHTWFLVVVLVVGLALVVAGALWGVIPAATAIAEFFGVSKKIIGLTVVAFGTSLPELVTCVVASVKGETDIAVGDIVGSNIFNILRTVGLCATILPLSFAPSFLVDGLIALGAALLLALFGYLKDHKVQRWEGGVMLACFAAYYVYLFVFA